MANVLEGHTCRVLILGAENRRLPPSGEPSNASLARIAAGTAAATSQKFRDLDRVQRGAFEQLIARNPKREAIVERAIHS